MSDMVLGITLKADGSSVKAELRAVNGDLKGLGDAGKKAGAAVADGSAAATRGVSGLAAQFGQAAQKQEQYAVSVKQMQSALRGVPAQFTDIITSLQAGQNPLQVFLQQGGQLKDMFGGAGPAARALGGYVAGLVTPLTVGAAAIVGLAVAAEAGRRESEGMARAIILTGNASGATVGKMQAYAHTVADVVGATRGAVADALTQMVATGKVSDDVLVRVTDAAIRLERAGGQAVEETVKQFAELGRSPVEASVKLNEQTNYLTGAVYRQIKALMDQGDASGAAALAQQAWANAIAERTPELEANLGLLERSWRGVRDAAKGAWDEALDIGRESKGNEKITELETRLRKLGKDRAYFESGGDRYAAGTATIEIDALNAELTILRQQVATEKQKAETAAATNDETKKQIKAQAEVDKSATHQVAMLKVSLDLLKHAPDSADKARRELELTRQIRDMYHSMGAEARAIANARIDGALKQAEVAANAASAHLTARNQLGQVSNSQMLNAQALGAERQLDNEIAALQTKRRTASVSEQAKMTADIDALEVQRLAARQETLDKADLMEDKAGRDSISRDAQIAKERGQTERAYTLDYIAKNQLAMREAYAAGNAELIAQMQTQFDAGLGNAQFTAVKQEYDTLFEQLKSELDAVRQAAERDGGWLAGINAAAKAEDIKSRLMPQLDELGEKLDSLAAKNPLSQKTAESAKRELQKTANEISPIWKKAVDGIDRTFHDGFSRMLEGGKNSWEAFSESLKNTFKTTVADAIYQMFARPFVFQIAAGAAGAMGFSGAANAFGAVGSGGGAGGVGNMLSMGSSLNNLLGGATAAYNTGAYMTLGSMGMEQAAMLAAQDAVFGAAGTAATLEAAGAGAFMSTIGTALPWIGGALAVASMLGAFDGGGEDPHNNTSATGFELGLAKSGVFAVQNADATGAPSMMTAGPTSGEGWWADSANLSAAQIAAINQQVGATFVQGHAMAQLLGVDPSVIDSANVDSRRDGTPGNGHIQGYFSSMEQAFAALGESIAVKIIPNLAEFQASGESLAQTAARITQEFVLTNKMAALMGKDAATAFGGNNLAGRDALIQSLGGVSGATTTFDSYYKNFHGEAERRADTTGNIAATLRALGIADVPATRDQFRALVEGQDLTTDAGRRMYATLLSVADAFAGITASADAAAKAMGTDRFRTRADYLFAQKTGVMPAYADGGDHPGGWAVVGEAGPEIRYMSPSRIYSNSDSKSLLDMSQVTQAIDALRADLRAVNASLARAANKTAKTLDKWDVDGLPAERVL